MWSRWTVSATALGLVALAASAGVSQHHGHAVGGHESEVPVAEGAVLRLEHDRGARELRLLVGPVDLPATGGADHGMRVVPVQLVELPITGWLTGFSVHLIDASGEPLPSTLLHHVNVITPDRRELFAGILQRVAAAGRETAPIRLPWPLGYPVEAGQRVMVAAMLHNPEGPAREGVTLELRIPYTPARSLLGRLSVQPLYLDVIPHAGSHSFDLPPGRSERSWEGRPAVSGRIIGLGGHLHDYAVELRLEDVTAGRLIWRTTPQLDAAGRVIGMPQDRFVLRRGLPGLPLRSDHVYRLTAVYDNPTGRTIPAGGMGALGGVIVPNPGTEWPDVDPFAPETRTDIVVTTRTGLPIVRHPDGRLAGGDPGPPFTAVETHPASHSHP